MSTAAAALAPPLAPVRARAPASPFIAFCVGCGVKLPPLRAAAIGCPHCGAELVRADGTRASVARATPWLRALASLVVPGAGQAWNGEPGKAVLVLLTAWLIVPWLLGVVDAWRVARRRSLAAVARDS